MRRWRAISTCSVSLTLLVMVGCNSGTDDARSLPSFEGEESDSTSIVPGGYSGGPVDGGGSITGRVRFDGNVPMLAALPVGSDQVVCGTSQPNNRLVLSADRGVSDVLVYLEGATSGKEIVPPGDGERTVDQSGCQYRPHLVAVPVGTWVRFRNSDPIAHNIRLEDANDSLLLNVAQANNIRVDSIRILRPGPLTLGCDYHSWMNGVVYALENPYYSVTAADGRFSIGDIPAGKYTLVVWHNGFEPKAIRDNTGRLVRYSYGEAYLRKEQVEVKRGGSVSLDIRITSATSTPVPGG